jgi:hypothetical protein
MARHRLHRAVPRDAGADAALRRNALRRCSVPSSSAPISRE